MGNQAVTYELRSTPGNPSTATWRLELFVSSGTQSGNQIEWTVYRVEIRDLAGTRTWIDAIPQPSRITWLVDHDDPDDPVPADFWEPPDIERTASGQGGSPDADYTLSAGSTARPPVPQIDLNFVLKLVNQTEAETDDDVDPWDVTDFREVD